MYNKKSVMALILLVAVVVLYPFVKSAGRSAEPPAPSLDTPAINLLAEKACIEDAAYMRENHMQILNDWRVQSVRDGATVYTARDGQEFPMSLEESCLGCHSNKGEFCDTCHTYSEVEPNCWDCHVGGN